MNYFRFKDKLMMPLMAITLLFCSCSKEELVMENGHGEKNGYRFVDLGLPSGTLWADFNIGTSSVEESGEYFAWGETLEKEAYDWYTYKWCQKSYNTLTKYCTSNEYGTKDDKKILETADDVATVKMGKPWSMPTKEDFQKLINECAWYWMNLNGVDGYMVAGSNDNFIFLPAAGCHISTDSIGKGSHGYYWTKSLDEDDPYDAHYLSFTPAGHLGSNTYHIDASYDRVHGFPVRAVIHQ